MVLAVHFPLELCTNTQQCFVAVHWITEKHIACMNMPHCEYAQKAWKKSMLIRLVTSLLRHHLIYFSSKQLWPVVRKHKQAARKSQDQQSWLPIIVTQIWKC